MSGKCKSLYAVYKGDVFITLGTAAELARELNVSVDTIYWLVSPEAHARFGYGAKLVYRIEGMEVEDDQI